MLLFRVVYVVECVVYVKPPTKQKKCAIVGKIKKGGNFL